jgi:chloramphenicol-sensitive protein RarD
MSSVAFEPTPPGIDPALTQRATQRSGVVFGASAHLLWGFLPLYFKLVDNVPSLQILAHRVVWSLLLILAITAVRSDWSDLRKVLRDRRAILMLCASTILLSTNWYVFIYAVNSGHVVDASLGYFINPLLSVTLGMIFLGERTRRWQTFALLVAASGIAYLTCATLGNRTFPWIALVLPVTFGFYSLLRKTVRAGAFAGLTVETAFMFIPALIVILVYHHDGHSYDARTWSLLPFAGVVTAVPYLFFAAAARRLRLMTMGFLQYLTPSCHFLLGVFAFHEELSKTDLISFSLIWIALAIYSWDSYRAYKRQSVVKPLPRFTVLETT